MARRRKQRRSFVPYDRGFFIARRVAGTDLDPIIRQVLEGTGLPVRPPRFTDRNGIFSRWCFKDLPPVLFENARGAIEERLEGFFAEESIWAYGITSSPESQVEQLKALGGLPWA